MECVNFAFFPQFKYIRLINITSLFKLRLNFPNILAVLRYLKKKKKWFFPPFCVLFATNSGCWEIPGPQRYGPDVLIQLEVTCIFIHIAHGLPDRLMFKNNTRRKERDMSDLKIADFIKRVKSKVNVFSPQLQLWHIAPVAPLPTCFHIRKECLINPQWTPLA